MSAREHDWNGAFCSSCGADEASSFATAPCPGFAPARVPSDERRVELPMTEREAWLWLDDADAATGGGGSNDAEHDALVRIMVEVRVALGRD